MRLPALAAQLQEFAHSAERVCVGVSPLHTHIDATILRQHHSELRVASLAWKLFVGQNAPFLLTPPIM